MGDQEDTGGFTCLDPVTGVDLALMAVGSLARDAPEVTVLARVLMILLAVRWAVAAVRVTVRDLIEISRDLAPGVKRARDFASRMLRAARRLASTGRRRLRPPRRRRRAPTVESG